ncbi:MAG: sigma-70 family RNA polymerase sigma factor [Planctomycetota bacterium]|nr:sigma-70 family RNA polymerase sigma factor [Planctomycetota bacterium]
MAAGLGSTPAAEEAMGQLCRKYWYPLYVYVRRRGCQPEDAADLTQEFFARLLEKKYLGLADPQRGRFRSFLLTSLRCFLDDEWGRARTITRGGGRRIIPFELEQAEDRYRREPADDLTPEIVYERRWAVTLLSEVMDLLHRQYAAAGKDALFEALQTFAWGADTSLSYADVAVQLAMTEGAVKTAVYRLRGRYRQVLCGEIAQTVADPADVDDEVRRLFAVFG